MKPVAFSSRDGNSENRLILCSFEIQSMKLRIMLHTVAHYRIRCWTAFAMTSSAQHFPIAIRGPPLRNSFCTLILFSKLLIRTLAFQLVWYAYVTGQMQTCTQWQAHWLGSIGVCLPTGRLGDRLIYFCLTIFWYFPSYLYSFFLHNKQQNMPEKYSKIPL